jgi:glycosyltransferase involved in cell wall biosynthesis
VRVIIFTQFFTPEVGATQTRLHSFAQGLAKRGHDVEVVCEVPNHPQGVVHQGFRGRWVVRRQEDDFRVRHVWVATSPSKTTRTRLAFYASYAAAASIVASALPRPDVILASSPPLPVAAAAALVAKRHRVPWVMDVRDLWPEAAVALGELSNARLLALAERLERWLYEDAAAIVTVTEPFEDLIAEKTRDPEKISLIANGTTRLWIEGARLEPDRRALELPESEFLWTYAGNVGPAQGLEAAVDAASALGDGFRLLVLGDGAAVTALRERAAAVAPDRVVFRGQVAPEEAVRHVRASDALLVPLSGHPVLRTFVPSKLFDFCAAGRPVIVAAAGEPARLAGASGAAIAVPPDDAEQLAAALRQLRGDPELRERLEAAGRAFGASNRRELGIDRLEAVLQTTRRPPPAARAGTRAPRARAPR